MNPITVALSKTSGIPEPTLRLLLTLILAYPVSFVYNKRYTDSKKASDRTLYIALTGFALNFFFNGVDIYHSLVTISASYAICYVLGEYKGNRKLAAGGVWIFNAVYLLLGYYNTETDEYDITWTMTQCILCLRLMGFGFDYYDGRVVKERVSQVEKEVTKTAIREPLVNRKPQVLPLSFGADTALNQLPSVTELMAYCLFPSAFLVGPQFSFSLFKNWINDTRENLTNEQLKERQQAKTFYVWRCVLLAAVYLGLQQTVGAVYSTSYLLTEEYSSLSFLKRLLILFVSGKFGYNKYIGIWLLTEGATASFGISYEGVNSSGHALYSGLANALPGTYQTATSIDQVISAFNVNTNYWSKYYVFKRLKFLGSKELSQFGTLLFLAIWHGFHAMYFVTFLLEFLYVQCELIFRQRIGFFVQPYTKQYLAVHYLWKAVAWCACQMCITYAMVGFELLSVDKAIAAYKNVYYIGHLIVPIIFAVHKLAPKPMVLKKKTH